jgi:hypothetical protein
MINTIEPASREEWLELRKPTIGASEIAALVGAHPFPQMTPYRLWALKRRLLEEEPETPAMRRGRHMEKGVAIDFLREERPEWVIERNQIPGGKFYADEDHHISATPDAFARDPEREGFGVVQIKSVEPHIFKKKWQDGDNAIRPPTGVAVQVIQEAALSGASWACVAPIVVSEGIDMPIVEIPLHKGVMDRLRYEAAMFWLRVKNNEPYEPDFAVDGKVIDRVFAEDDGGTIDLGMLDPDQVARLPANLRRRELLAACEATGRAAEAERKVIDAELKWMLKNAARLELPDGRVIEAKTIHKKGYPVAPTSYRQIKIKEKTA